jgi:NAD(P)-dependent dehydrogenase (short-subunit alcohol dehydrogenase family)
MVLITTPFGFQSIAAEVSGGIDLSGKRVIVTGATSGIGVETARALANIGADVTLAVRNTDVGPRVATNITATTGNRNIHVARLSLNDRASITAFVAAWDGPLHVLVNNAGIFAPLKAHFLLSRLHSVNPFVVSKQHDRMMVKHCRFRREGSIWKTR